MGFTVLEIQTTPNPNAAKLVLDREVAAQPTSFFSAESAKDNDLASKLLAIAGVTSLLMLGDFITINKRPDAQWADITMKVKQVLAAA